MAEIKVGIAGCGGRMGRLLVAEIAASPGMRLAGGRAAAPERSRPHLGMLAGLQPTGVVVSADPTELLARAQVVIDFTVPAASAALATAAAAAGVALVIGTTGHDERELASLHAAASCVPVVMAANFSIGVNLLRMLVRDAAAKLGSGFDIEIVEMHHRRKIDAPSGTALALGAAAADGLGLPLDRLRLPPRDGLTGSRPSPAIGFASLRGGDVVGDHTVIFAAEGERIELTHRAGDRRIFASGAVRAAGWVVSRAAGLYGMDNVLA
jgi:4-hydroxy-tetrahydrodipicolinate reductase